VADLTNDLLFIEGQYFVWANDSQAIVTLAGSALPVDGVTSTQIQARLPPGLLPGSYLLAVSRGAGAVQNAAFALTIGAVGPAGPQGVKGSDGSQGIAGETGERGQKGDTGGQGPPGPSGLAGYQVVDQSSAATGFDKMVEVSCPQGQIALSGGARLIPPVEPPERIFNVALQTTAEQSRYSLDLQFSGKVRTPLGITLNVTGGGVEAGVPAGQLQARVHVDFRGAEPIISGLELGGQLTAHGTFPFTSALDGTVDATVSLRPTGELLLPAAPGQFNVPVDVSEISEVNVLGLTIGGLAATGPRVTVPVSVALQRVLVEGWTETYTVTLTTGSFAASVPFTFEDPDDWEFHGTLAGQAQFAGAGEFSRKTLRLPTVTLESHPTLSANVATGWAGRASLNVPFDEAWALGVSAICVNRP
jgi:hypothetical protein